MTKEELEKKLRSIVMEHMCLEDHEITNESNFYDDLGADSLDIVEMVMAVEEEFEIEIPDEDVDGLTTFGKAVEYLVEKVK